MAIRVLNQEYVADFDLSTLVGLPGNPRKGDKEAISESVDENGFYGALVVQRSTNKILVGNHRHQTLMEAGQVRGPVFLVDVDDEQATRIAVADNRASDRASTDESLLHSMLSQLNASAARLRGTGFTQKDMAGVEKRLEKLKASAAASTSTPGSSAPVGSGNMRLTGGPVVAYTLVFDNEEQQSAWYDFLRWAKTHYPDESTIGARVVAFVKEHASG